MRKILLFAFLSYAVAGILGLIGYHNHLALFKAYGASTANVIAIATSTASAPLTFSGGLDLVGVILVELVLFIIALFLLPKWQPFKNFMAWIRKHFGTLSTTQFFDLYFTLVLCYSMYVLFVVLATFVSLPFSVVLSQSWVIRALLVLGFLLIAIDLYYHRKKRHFNLIALVIGLGLSYILGVILSPFDLIILLLIIAVYDWIAVFVTKHMVALGDMAAKFLLPVMFIEGSVEGLNEKLSKMRDQMYIRCLNCGYIYKDAKSKTRFKCPICKREGYYKDKKKVIVFAGNPKADYKDNSLYRVYQDKYNSSALGLGDIVFPAMIVLSFAYIGNILWIFAALGAGLGMILNMVWLEKKKQAIPAIPLIAVAMVGCLALGVAIQAIL